MGIVQQVVVDFLIYSRLPPPLDTTGTLVDLVPIFREMAENELAKQLVLSFLFPSLSAPTLSLTLCCVAKTRPATNGYTERL